MPDIFRYDFNYSWYITYGHLVPLGLAAAFIAVVFWRRWPRWLFGPAGLLALWSLVGLFITHGVLGLNSPLTLPTAQFLASGSGRVLDAGAGSGRAAIGVLLSRPNATVTGLDIYSGYWGIDDNTPERFMTNVRAAGAEGRADVRTSDMRKMPFGDAEFDAVISLAAIDHLRRDGVVQALAEIVRVLKPNGQALVMNVNVDWWAIVGSPHAIGHHPRQDPARWRSMLQQAGLTIEEEGTRPAVRYWLARKR